MRYRNLLATAALVAGGMWASSASASVVLSDDFGSTGAVGNWSGDGTFLSIPQPGNVSGSPSVDLVGHGFFSSLAYSGNSVDLDGSTGSGFSPAGKIQSVMSLPSGDYTVSFLLAGNMRGAAVQTTQVCLGSQCVDISPPLPAGQGYTPELLQFKGASGQLSFADLGPSTQQGNLLDNVSVGTGVPEVSTWAMMLLGFAGLGFAGYRRGKKGTFALSAA